jgi:hypothetical protein
MGVEVASEARTPQQIEHEIERTRERMSHNLDALGERLSPDSLKQRAREAIAGKAEDVLANLGDQARRTGARLLDLITEHPLPAAAVGLGVIGLFFLRRGRRGRKSGGRRARLAHAGPERRR